MNGWTKWLVGTLWGVLVGVILFMGQTVRANDNKATLVHTEIRKEVKEADDCLRKELMAEIKDLQMEQKAMRKETNESFTEVLIAIEKIKK